MIWELECESRETKPIDCNDIKINKNKVDLTQSRQVEERKSKRIITKSKLQGIDTNRASPVHHSSTQEVGQGIKQGEKRLECDYGEEKEE